jgi:hypothetical protein
LKSKEEHENQTVNAVVLLSTFTTTNTPVSEARFLTLVDKESTQYKNMKDQVETKSVKYVV